MILSLPQLDQGLAEFRNVCKTSDLLDSATRLMQLLDTNKSWRSIENKILPVMCSKNIGVLCYSTLQQGLLSGRYKSPDQVADGRKRTRLYGPQSCSKTQCRHEDPRASLIENAVFDVTMTGSVSKGTDPV